MVRSKRVSPWGCCLEHIHLFGTSVNLRIKNVDIDNNENPYTKHMMLHSNHTCKVVSVATVCEICGEFLFNNLPSDAG